MAINTDPSGFLVGENRLKELNKGVDKVHSDTSAILAILMGQIQQEAITRDRNYKQIAGIGNSVTMMAKAKPSVSVTINTGNSKVTRKTAGNISVDTGSTFQAAKNTSQTKEVKKTGGSRERGANGRFTSKTSQAGQDAGRDSRGRFTSSASGINERTFLDSIKKGIDSSNIGMQADVSNLDPTVDAVRELTTLFEPGKKAFSLMGRGAMWLFKRRKSAKAEDIPRVQSEHNDEVERHNHEERKLLRKLIDAVNRGNSNGLAGLLGPALLSRLMGGGGGKNGRNGRNAPNTPDKDKDQKKKPSTPVPVGGGGGGGGKGKPKTPDTNTPNKAPGRIGKLLGGLGKRVPFLGTLLGAGMLANGWSDMDAEQKGGGIGSIVGGGIGATLGAFGGPVGALAGASAGAYIGDSIGSAVGKWTGNMDKQNIGGTMIKGWNTTLDLIQNYFKLSMYGIGRFGGMGVGFMRASYGGGGIGRPGSGAGGYGGGLHSSSGRSEGGKLSGEADKNQSAVYNSMIKAGFSKSQAMALTAEVGREGGYSSDHLFGTHKDEANNLTNMGMISWQGSRRTRMLEHLTKKGLYKNGQMVRGQATLDAQAEYLKWEVENDPAYKATKKMFADNPDANPEQYSKTIGKNLIGWAYGQDVLSSGKAFPWKTHDARRRGHLETIEKKVNSLGGGSTQQSNGVKQVSLTTAATANQTRPLYASNSAAVKPAAVPAAPNVVRRTSGQETQPVLMASSNDTISQNPADRDIAHAITGGLGMRMQMA